MNLFAVPFLKVFNLACFLLLFTHILALDKSVQLNEMREHAKDAIERFKAKLNNIIEESQIRRSRSFSNETLFTNYKAFFSCASKLEKAMFELDKKIKNEGTKSHDIWTRDEIANVSEVFVNGSVISNQASEISRISFNSKPYSRSSQSISDSINYLYRKVKKLQHILRNAVFKSKYQLIKSNIDFENGMIISHLYINKLMHHSSINKVHTSLLASALKKNGSQIIPFALVLSGAHAKFVITNLLNSNEMKDYLLLERKWQLVRGNFIFKTLSVNNIILRNELNNIHMDDIVIISSSQNITGYKTFNFLSSNSVTTNGYVNQMNISNFKCIYNDDAEFLMMLNFTSDVVINNIKLQSLNGLNLTHMTVNSVKYSENQIIKGLKVFTQVTIIEQNLSILGSLNEIELDNFMTLHTQQNIYKKVDFLNVAFKEIKTHSVNNIDLHKEAIQKSGNFKVEDTMTFLQSLEANDIILKDGVTIDTMDPSTEASHFITAIDHIFNDSLEFSNIRVLNNMEIEDIRVKTLLNKLVNNTWQKTKPQNVQYGPINIFKYLNATSMEVNRLNGILLKDIVTCKEIAAINSSKHFENVQVRSHSLQGGKTINDIDFTSRSLILLLEKKLKSFVVVNMSVNGNLDVSAFNFMNISDLMQIRKSQKCAGNNVFDNIILEKMIATNLDFHIICNRRFSEYMTDIMFLSDKPFKDYIINKKFIYLSGQELNNAGFLNERKVEDFFQSVVTLNYNQSIYSNIQFLNKLNMKVLFVKNFSVNNLSDVICIDEPQNIISNKEFKRIFANKAVFENINGINISSLQNVFYKSKNNQLIEAMNFVSDLKMSNVQVQSLAMVDGMKIDDAVRLKDAFKTSLLKFSNVNVKNIIIRGRINECNLLDVIDMLQKNVSVKVEKHISSLIIDGNLHIKCTLNSLPENFLTSVSFGLKSITDFKGRLNLSDIKITHLNISSLINGFDVNFLLNDSVMQKKTQVIKGIKSFKKKITANNVDINSLNVTFLNKFNIPLLYNKYLSKKKDQIIFLNLRNVTAEKIFIEGRINEIKVPEDVFLVYTDEKIFSAVLINETINSTDIFLTTINGIDLSLFLNDKVSLENSENISSILIFLKDFSIKGNLKVVNSINKINLNYTLRSSAKNVQSTIVGNKYFLADLSLNSGMNVSDFINNISFSNLSKKLCRKNESEFLKDKVIFFNIQASTLNAMYINDISIEYLWTIILDIESTIHNKLDNFTDIINLIDDELQKINIIKNSSLATLAFFELHQVLKIGHTVRFLPMYEAGIYGQAYELPITGMTVWINQNETCRRFKSIVMDVQLNGSLEETRKVQGRIFPFSLRFIDEDVQGFKLHVDRSKRCTLENQKADILKTIFTSGNDSVYIMTSPISSMVLDAKLLETEEGVFLIIAYEFEVDEEKIYLYKYNIIDDTWSEHQKFHTSNISSFDVIYRTDMEQSEAYLAVTGANASPGIYFYIWDFEVEEFALKSKTPKSVTSSVFWSNTDEDMFLLLSKEESKVFKNNVWTVVHTESVEVYILKDDLKLDHEINIHGISSFDTFKLFGETYILAVSRHLQTIYIIQYQGFNGFQVIQDLHVPGVDRVTVFCTQNDIFLAVSSNTGHTRILKCIIRGGKFIANQF